MANRYEYRNGPYPIRRQFLSKTGLGVLVALLFGASVALAWVAW